MIAVIVTVVSVVVILISFSKNNLPPQQIMGFSQGSFCNSRHVLKNNLQHIFKIKSFTDLFQLVLSLEQFIQIYSSLSHQQTGCTSGIY